MYLMAREFNSTSSINKSQGNWTSKIRRRIRLFSKRSAYAPLGILISLFSFQELCGVFIVTFYSVNLFHGIGSNFGSGVDEYTATVIMGIERFLMTIAVTILLMRVGRRPLMLISSIGMTISMFTAAVLSSISSTQTLDFSKSTPQVNATVTAAVDDPVDLITIVALLIFVLFASVGFLNIPWILISELLPTNVRGMGNGLMMSYALIVMFAVIKGVPFLLDFINLSSLFYMFALISLSSAVYIKIFLPETFRKSFIEIEQLFRTTSKP